MASYKKAVKMLMLQLVLIYSAENVRVQIQNI